MSIFKFGLPVLNMVFKKARVGKKAQKIFENLYKENQAAGLSSQSAYTSARKELIDKYKLKVNLKGQVTNRSEGGEIVIGKNVDKDLL